MLSCSFVEQCRSYLQGTVKARGYQPVVPKPPWTLTQGSGEGSDEGSVSEAEMEPGPSNSYQLPSESEINGEEEQLEPVPSVQMHRAARTRVDAGGIKRSERRVGKGKKEREGREGRKDGRKRRGEGEGRRKMEGRRKGRKGKEKERERREGRKRIGKRRKRKGRRKERKGKKREGREGRKTREGRKRKHRRKEEEGKKGKRKGKREKGGREEKKREEKEEKKKKEEREEERKKEEKEEERERHKHTHSIHIPPYSKNFGGEENKNGILLDINASHFLLFFLKKKKNHLDFASSP
ncbi:Histone-lysine N-methyltransferase, H3 lysine-79 specific, partial [Ophiophagus hannah]